MSIKFVCSCGKRLRARESMASRRSLCPRCGNPVGIPSLQSLYPGTTQGPMTPAERVARQGGLRLSPDAETSAQTDSSLTRPPEQHSSDRVADLRSSRAPESEQAGVSAGPKVARRTPPSQRGSRLLTLPSECLFYTMRAWPLILGLAVALAALTVSTELLLPMLVELRKQTLAALAPGLLLPLLIVGYAWGFLEAALASGLTGDDRHIGWSGPYVGSALKSGIIWVICFLAGPIVPALLSLLYWIQCGDPVFLDWLILAELGIVCLSYWLFVLLAVNQRGRLLDVNPIRVADLIHALGAPAVAVVFVAAVVALAHGRFLLTALVELHRDPAGGILSLIACWTSGLGWAAFLLRLLGGCCRV